MQLTGEIVVRAFSLPFRPHLAGLFDRIGTLFLCLGEPIALAHTENTLWNILHCIYLLCSRPHPRAVGTVSVLHNPMCARVVMK